MEKQRDKQKGPDYRKPQAKITFASATIKQMFLHMITGSYSAIVLTLCDPTSYMDYTWRVHDNTCESDHFPIILENTDP